MGVRLNLGISPFFVPPTSEVQAMQQLAGLATYPGAVTPTTHPPKAAVKIMTAKEINERDKGSRECHMLFLASLNGRAGHPEAPRDGKERSRFMADARKIIQATYGLDDPGFERMSEIYCTVDGPKKVATLLDERRSRMQVS